MGMQNLRQLFGRYLYYADLELEDATGKQIYIQFCSIILHL